MLSYKELLDLTKKKIEEVYEEVYITQSLQFSDCCDFFLIKIDGGYAIVPTFKLLGEVDEERMAAVVRNATVVDNLCNIQLGIFAKECKGASAIIQDMVSYTVNGMLVAFGIPIYEGRDLVFLPKAVAEKYGVTRHDLYAFAHNNAEFSFVESSKVVPNAWRVRTKGFYDSVALLWPDLWAEKMATVMDNERFFIVPLSNKEIYCVKQTDFFKQGFELLRLMEEQKYRLFPYRDRHYEPITEDIAFFDSEKVAFISAEALVLMQASSPYK